MTMAESYAPLRNLADVEALERVPLEARIFSWNLNDWLDRGCACDPGKIAIRYVADGNPDSPEATLTYRELHQRSRQVANLFHSLGVGPADPVIFLLPTVPELFVVMLGSVAAGIACSINWMLKGEQLAELIRSTRAKVIVTLGPTPGFEIWENLQAVRDAISPSVRILTVAGPGGKTHPDSDLLTLAAAMPGDRLNFKREVKPADIAALIHSGGTTSSPKLVKLTHRGFAYKCWANAVVMAHTAADVMFADYPMFHIAGIFGRGYIAIAYGMQIVIPTPLGARDKRFIDNYWRFVEKFKINFFSGVPTTLAQLAKSKPNGDLSSLRDYACTGSTAFPAEVARQIEAAIGVRVLLTYGATEYTQNVTQAPRDGDPKYGSPGIRLPYTQVKTVELDDNGHVRRECKTDEIGVVIVKGPSVTPGYLDPKYNAGIFTADGWFVSGDVGRFDADGYLWLTGRIKDVIIRGGHNIDPTVIEETLLKHPEVLLAAAVSKPDSYAGELPIAYVQLTTDARVTVEELQKFALDHIPERPAAPKEIVVLDRMPLTDVGKPVKTQLRADAARRAYREALDGVMTGKFAVEMVADPVKGQVASIKVVAEVARRAAVEASIHDKMKAFATAYRIEWA
jgi:fatty-acyl-CoA synthase